MNEADAEKLLRLLVDAGLPFTLVGGLAAIAHGASTFTRDVDVAMETADLTRNSILQQAATSVLAQANAQPQLALSLLG